MHRMSRPPTSGGSPRSTGSVHDRGAKSSSTSGRSTPAERGRVCPDRARARGPVSVASVKTVLDAVARQGRDGRGRDPLSARARPRGCEPVAGVFEARMARLLANQGPAAGGTRVRGVAGAERFVARESTSPTPRSASPSRSTGSPRTRPSTRSAATAPARTRSSPRLDRPALHLGRGRQGSADVGRAIRAARRRLAA